MQFKLFTIVALAAFVAARPTVNGGGDPEDYHPEEPQNNGGECSVDQSYCCNSLQKANSPSITSILGLLGGIEISDITALVGVQCSPLSLIGGSVCNAEPVCCSGNTYKGLINVGCVPINIA